MSLDRLLELVSNLRYRVRLEFHGCAPFCSSSKPESTTIIVLIYLTAATAELVTANRRPCDEDWRAVTKKRVNDRYPDYTYGIREYPIETDVFIPSGRGKLLRYCITSLHITVPEETQFFFLDAVGLLCLFAPSLLSPLAAVRDLALSISC